MGGAVKAVAKVVGSAAGFFGGPLGTLASLAFQGYSMMQERKQGKRASRAATAQAQIQQKQEESRVRYSQVQAQRERIAQQRQARIRQGQLVGQAGAGGVGLAGTSGFTGASSSIASQLGTNIGNIGVAQGFAQEQSGYNIAAAQQATTAGQATASAAGWNQMATLASNVNPGNFGNIFDIEKKA